ncbi:MAG: hypothetical protein Q4D19_00700 [Lautropia sp.]|nr:hypothetical protein [Lautropia sp.]
MRYQIRSFLNVGNREVFEFCRSRQGFCSHFPFPVEWKEGADVSWEEGDFIDFRYRAYGIWLRHRARVSACDPPRMFTDVQETGLYRKFVHTHRFEPEGNGTWVIDDIEFTLGYGALLDRLFGWPTIHAVFRKRHRNLQKIFGLG